jgi:hypothetical protein
VRVQRRPRYIIGNEGAALSKTFGLGMALRHRQHRRGRINQREMPARKARGEVACLCAGACTRHQDARIRRQTCKLDLDQQVGRVLDRLHGGELVVVNFGARRIEMGGQRGRGSRHRGDPRIVIQ